MAFDQEGYRRAAASAGVPKQLIEQTIASNTGTKGWFTNGKSGLGGAASALGNTLNLSSYGAGGLLNRIQQGTGNKYAQGETRGTGILDGIRNKRAIMTELPETIGVDPNSTAGKAIGFGGELLMPVVPGAGQIGKLAKGANILGDASKTADAVGDATRPGLLAKTVGRGGGVAEEFGAMTPFRGLGRNNTTKNLISNLQRRGVDPADFMDEYNLWDRSMEGTQSALRGVDDAYKTAAYNSDELLDTQKIVGAFDTEIQKLVPQAQQSRAAQTELKRLVEARDGFIDSIRTADNATPLQTPLGAVAESKSIVSKDIPQSYFNLGSAQKGAGKGAESARRIFKKQLDTATGTTAKLGADESALINYKKLLQGQQAANMGNKNISFPKMIAPFGGFAAGGIPGAAAAWAGEQFLNSPIGIKAQSKGLTKAGKILTNPKTQKVLNKAQKYGTRGAVTGFRVNQQPERKTNINQSPVKDTKKQQANSSNNPGNFNIKLFNNRSRRGY